MLLLSAVFERLGRAALRTGVQLKRFGQNAHGVHLELFDRSEKRATRVEADALIGCDGIHSVVRAQLHPHETRPPWNGIQMFRGVTETAPFLTGRSMIVAGSNRRAKFVAYSISKRADERGRALVNWVAEVNLGTDGLVAPENWNREVALEVVEPHFAEFRFDWLDVPGLIAGASAIYEYPMVDRDPLPSWGDGRVTLLGDAAHPMYPVGSNGGSQAIVDARVLAFELSRRADVGAALAAYEEKRRPQTSALVLAARNMGPDRFLAAVEERAPNGFKSIGDVLTADELSELDGDYERLTGLDARELNQRATFDVAEGS
jgi:2-polyprenyl-6-methoxyphenol hydroxylase-like FAD-dependent oxidoreductase